MFTFLLSILSCLLSTLFKNDMIYSRDLIKSLAVIDDEISMYICLDIIVLKK
jgi:hypothetical protein